MNGSAKPDDRNGHVRFEVAGAGNGFTVELVRHRQTKETVTDRLHLRDTAPVLDPTLSFRIEDWDWVSIETLQIGFMCSESNTSPHSPCPFKFSTNRGQRIKDKLVVRVEAIGNVYQARRSNVSKLRLP